MSALTDRALSERARRTLAGLRYALPERECAPVECWLAGFYDYQLEWILDWSRRSLLNKARQIGASHAYAGAAVLFALLGEANMFVSVGEREAIELLEKSAIHAKILRQLGSRSLQLDRNNKQELRFVSGGRILALPSSSAARGFSGNVFLDEFAYHEKPEAIWDGASGAITKGFKLRVMSTPNGVGNMWHQIYTDPERNEGYTLHEVTLEQALAAGLENVSMEECWHSARNDPRVFDQLYNCKFLGTELQYIPTEAVKDCSKDSLYTYEGDHFAGLDIGRKVDKTVLIVVRSTPAGLRLVQHIASSKRTDGDALQMMVDWAWKRFKLRRMVVDATGIGTFPAERIAKRYGRTRVEQLDFSAKSKAELATCLYDAFTEGSVHIPKTDKVLPDTPPGSAVALRDDLCSIRREVTKSNNVIYDAPSTDKGHADSAWALAMALRASGSSNRKRHEVKLSGGKELIY